MGILNFGLKDKELNILKSIEQHLEEIRLILEVLAVVVSVGLLLIFVMLVRYGKT